MLPSTQCGICQTLNPDGCPRFLLSGWELAESSRRRAHAVQRDHRCRPAGTGTAAGNANARDRITIRARLLDHAINPGHPENYIICSVSFPAPGTLGNLGRNTLRAPAWKTSIFRVFKNHNLRGGKEASAPG